jgi:hypothetical protein
MVLDDAYEVQKFVPLTPEEKADLKDITLVINEAFKRTKTIVEVIKKRPEIVAIAKAAVPEENLFSWEKHDAKVAKQEKKRKIDNATERLKRQLARLEAELEEIDERRMQEG